MNHLKGNRAGEDREESLAKLLPLISVGASRPIRACLFFSEPDSAGEPLESGFQGSALYRILEFHSHQSLGFLNLEWIQKISVV